MSYRVIGTCSICGGRVTIPTVWMGIYPPEASCERCGAVPAKQFGPVIPMVPSQPWNTQPHTAPPYELPYDDAPWDTKWEVTCDDQRPSWDWSHNDIEFR